MSSEAFEKVNMTLRLYEMRREEGLRKARAWFVDEFRGVSAEEFMQKYPPGSKENAYFRQVVSFWDMCAGVANRGLVDEELFFENAGEAWLVLERVKGTLAQWRAAFKNPHICHNLETFVGRMEAWQEKRAPGSSEARRQMIQMMEQARAKTAVS